MAMTTNEKIAVGVVGVVAVAGIIYYFNQQAINEWVHLYIIRDVVATDNLTKCKEDTDCTGGQVCMNKNAVTGYGNCASND